MTQQAPQTNQSNQSIAHPRTDHDHRQASISSLAERVEASLLSAIKAESTSDGSAAPDSAAIARRAHDVALRLDPLAPASLLDTVAAHVASNLTGLGVLDPLLADPTVTELMVNAGRVWVERNGKIESITGFTAPITDDAVLRVVERVTAPLGLELNRAHPMLDARLPDGSRLNVIVPPLAVDGPCLTIRRFAQRGFALDQFDAPAAVQTEIIRSVADRRNILVSGSTGSGKTTLLNTIGSLCSPADRIITIEDAAELRLSGNHVVRLETRPGAYDGTGRVTIRDLVRNALRMRPDRIIVGEVRGGEAFDMITALNTGHDGSMTTVHANSALDALRRLELMFLLSGIELPVAAVREQIASAIHVVIHVSRQTDGTRRIAHIGRVKLFDGQLTLDDATEVTR